MYAAAKPSKLSSSGFGKSRAPQWDARGIFLTYTCNECHHRKMAQYRADVLTDASYWTDEAVEGE